MLFIGSGLCTTKDPTSTVMISHHWRPRKFAHKTHQQIENMQGLTVTSLIATGLLLICLWSPAQGFVTSRPQCTRQHLQVQEVVPSTFQSSQRQPTQLAMAQVTQQEAQKGIDKVVQALRKDSKAKEELGRLVKVTNVLGFGSPSAGSLAVRFNASFQKSGFGRSSIPLPFGLGQSNESEGRGQMVGQVKASLDMKTGKLTECSVFRDLGYGRAFNLKV